MQYVRIQTPLHANTSATIHRGEVMSQYRPEEGLATTGTAGATDLQT